MAATSLLHLSITTPLGMAFSGDCQAIFCTTDAGPILILPHHASLLASISNGQIRIDQAASTASYHLRNATLAIDNHTNTVTISALLCEEESQTTYVNAENYLKLIQERLENPTLQTDTFEYKFLASEKIAVEQQIRKSKTK